MIKSFFRYTFLMIGAAALLTACDSYQDDNWSPGEKVADGVQGAFFSTDNASGFSVSDSSEFSIIINRIDTAEAATVPITLVSRDTTAIEIPSAISFEAGQSTATLVCKAEGLTVDSLYSFTIAIDSTQVNPYAAGSSTFTATVTNGELWRDVITDAYTYFYYNKKYTYDYRYATTIQQYLKTNEFYVENFLNSGSGFYFRIQNYDGSYESTIEDINAIDGVFDPVDNEGVSVTEYSSYSMWAFYAVFDDGTSDWSWQDAVNGITWTSFMGYGGSDYANFYGTYKYIELICYPSVNGKGTYSGLYIDWR